jgi:hypothetical protein
MMNAALLALLIASSSLALQSEKPKQKKAENEQPDRREQIIRIQALDLLKDIPADARALESAEERAEIVSAAAETLWKHDPARAREIFVELFDDLLVRLKSEYEANEKKESVTRDLQYGIRIALRAMARRDPSAADSMLARYYKLREEALKDKAPRSQEERLELARASLDVSLEQSVSIARRMLAVSIPFWFSQYLNELSAHDKAMADTLFREALINLSTARFYSPDEAAFLGAYPFKEQAMLLVGTHEADGRREFHLFNSNPLTPPDGDFDLASQREYLAAAYRYLSAMPTIFPPGKAHNINHIANALFLAHRLGLYAARFGLDPEGRWIELERALRAFVANNNIDEGLLEWIKQHGQRQAQGEPIFDFDSAKSFEEAKATKDARQRLGFLVDGIALLADEEIFGEAEQHLIDIVNLDARRQVRDFIKLREAQSSIRNHRLEAISGIVSAIENPDAKLFALIDCARAAVESRQRGLALEMMNEAMKIIPRLEDKRYQAEANVAACAILSEIDPGWSRQMLAEVKKAINRAADYKGRAMEFFFALPEKEGRHYFSLRGFNLELCFERAARDDWTGATGAAGELVSIRLRLKARLAACRAFL